MSNRMQLLPPTSRRAFLYMSGSALLTSALASCDLSPKPTDSSAKTRHQGRPQKGREAPHLTELVHSGKLPAIEHRLPETPLTVPVVDRLGDYGGTWNTAILGPGDANWMILTAASDRMVRWDPKWTKIIPDVAESYAINDEATEFTFTLRKGMKWSDGHPFSVTDVMFWYEDIFSNKELYPAADVWLRSGTDPVVIKQIDDYRVRFIFSAPNSLLPQWLAAPYRSFYFSPRHYLEQFHKRYNKDIDKVVKENKAQDWAKLFLSKVDYWSNPDLPTLQPWHLTTGLGTGSQVVLDRNPYYWKVDPKGNQLPYIDRVIYDIIRDEQTMTLKAANGDLGMHSWVINTPTNKPVLARSRSRGHYHFFDLTSASLNNMIIALNLTHKDPVKRQIFRNKDFRIGLSYAMNRQEIIDVVYRGQGEPWQAAPRPEAPFADPEMAKQYTQHDVTLANKHLDMAGYSKRNSSGARLGPDGKPISFSIMAINRYFDMLDALDMIRGYWKAVGVDMQVQNVDVTLWSTRLGANTHDAAVDIGENGYKDAVLDARWFFPAYFYGAAYGVLWYNWYANAEGEKEEPPPAMRREMELYNRVLLAKKDPAAQYAVMRQIVQLAKENFWVMGTSLPAVGYGIVRDDFHNVPKSMWDAFKYPTPGATDPHQYFIDGQQ